MTSSLHFYAIFCQFCAQWRKFELVRALEFQVHSICKFTLPRLNTVEQSRIENEGDPFWIEHQIPEGIRKNQLLFASWK